MESSNALAATGRDVCSGSSASNKGYMLPTSCDETSLGMER